ncbi:MAG: hypothetical protein ACKV19_23185 [Verrucomicrobiales bacterium]
MRISPVSLCALCFVASIALPMPSLDARIVDDFQDGQKLGWTDFTFQAGFGIASETGGQFRIEQPPAGTSIFSASRRTSELLELKEGRTLELRIDLVEGGGKDSFAVLAFLPEASDTSTLGGYGLAKSTTDFLLTKGINKYFYNEHPAEAVKNENVSLVLTLRAQNGAVHIRGRVLDKDAGDAVIFEQTAVDTAAADVMADGTDSPPAPFLAKGHFALYLYQDFDIGEPEDPYKVVFDNAEVFETDRVVLDNFDDNTKTGWTDFNFQTGLGVPVETSGQFRFEQPPAGRPFFSASRRMADPLDLREGERLQLEVDLIEGGGADSFPVLAFIPKENDTSSLAGYGLAKSTTDLLISKGINRYFFNEHLEPAIQQDNIRMGLILTARQGRVEIEAEIHDLNPGGGLVYRQTAVDTSAADVMADGSDEPAAPFVAEGHYALYLYQDYSMSNPEDPYKAYFDNAVVHTVPAAPNAAPVITDVTPGSFANFLPATTAIGFVVTDDQAIDASKISVTVNGTVHTTANGLVLAGTGTTRSGTLSGVLAANGNYSVVITASDAATASATTNLFFDTFAADTLVVEAEDYNFDGGGFINSPVPIVEGTGPEPNAYGGQFGFSEVDYFETRGAPNGTNTMYRFSDPIRMQRSFDLTRLKYTNAGGAAAGIYDYEVGDFAAGEWMNYTRTFPSGSYQVFLRQSQVNHPTSECVLERVTSDPSETNQTTTALGSFLGVPSGFLSRNIPLTDGSGENLIVLRLDGPTTLRMRQVTTTPADASRAQNYLAFVRVSDVGPQRALISSLSPAPGTTVETVQPAISVEIQNRDTTVVPASVVLRLGGAAVPATVTATATGASVAYTYPAAALPPAGSLQEAQVSFRDNENNEISASWSFTVTYKSLNADYRSTQPGGVRGFQVRVVQAPAGSGLENSLQRAEDQLRPNSPYTAEVDHSAEVDLINFSEQEGGSGGEFQENLGVPGIDGNNGTDDFVLEVRCWLQLSKGIHRFGVISDDGFKVNAGATPADFSGAPLDFKNGGPANQTVDFVVPETGIYPFRFLWYERGGSAHAEWFSVDLASGVRTLINDPVDSRAVAAYRTVGAEEPPAVQASLSLAAGSWGSATDAVVDAIARTVTIPITGPLRYVRLVNPAVNGAAPVIRGVSIQGGALVISYDQP